MKTKKSIKQIFVYYNPRYVLLFEILFYCFSRKEDIDILKSNKQIFVENKPECVPIFLSFEIIS